MQSQPIKIPQPTSPSRFLVPLVVDGDEWGAMKDFNLYTQLLERWGFERKLEAVSLSHSNIHEKIKAGNLEDRQVWLHPAGIFATVKSYTTGGYTKSDKTVVPLQKALGSIHVTAMIDVGNGSELQHRAGVHIRGSGGSSPQFDGNCIRTLSDTFHSNTGGGLLKFFKTCQKYGRFLPFERWKDAGDRLFIDIPNEIMAPLTNADEGLTLDEALQRTDRKASWLKCAQQLPASLVDVLHSPSWSEDEKQEKPERRGPRWDPVEFGIKEFSEAMFLAGKRWAKPAERKLLDHWNRVALGEFGDTLDPALMRAYEEGPAGLSLPVALLYAKQSAPTAGLLLKKVLESAPEKVLLRWATEVDASGYTLALRAIDRSFTERMLDNHAPPQVDVLEILHRRLGAEGIVLSTPTRSVLGLPLQQDKRDEKQARIAQGELAQTIEQLDEWGLPWNVDLRWRNYPNLFKEEEGKPTFFQVEGPVNKDQWRDLLGANYTSALDPVLTRLERMELAHSTVAHEERSRPRSRL